MRPRPLIAAAAAAGLYCAAMLGIAQASAHVHASSDNPVRGGHAIVTFSVPNESPTGAPTTALSVALPDVASASTETMPGWTVKLDRDTAAGTVHSVTWTAAPNSGIPADQFALFRISVQLPDADTVSFPATQTYADGSVVKWDQPPLPGGGEPEHPAPSLALRPGPVAPPPHQHGTPHPGPLTDPAQAGQPKPAPDNTARLLAGTALLVAALGVALTLIRRRT
ncbi:YcnI family protein [Mycobacterium kyorinense]|uniref:YcnI family copper-binding membrane protein n=1 Tax=Mycobacterium kyorinense TaxID=487514 RepID=UPI0009DED78B